MSSTSSLKSNATVNLKNPQLIFNKLNHIKDPKEALL